MLAKYAHQSPADCCLSPTDPSSSETVLLFDDTEQLVYIFVRHVMSGILLLLQSAEDDSDDEDEELERGETTQPDPTTSDDSAQKHSQN